jgi:putative transposase
VYRCEKTNFYASKEAINRLFECNRVSARVWNRCLELSEEKYLKNGKTTKQFVDWCIKNQINEVSVGNVEGVQRNTSKRKKKKVRRRTTNQKLSNWSFGRLYDYLEYKLNAEGIEIRKVDESYTSQQCPCCGKKKNISSRIYECKCGYKQHRDIHGACNIFSKTYYGEIKELKFKLANTKYLRIA